MFNLGEPPLNKTKVSDPETALEPLQDPKTALEVLSRSDPNKEETTFLCSICLHRKFRKKDSEKEPSCSKEKLRKPGVCGSYELDMRKPARTEKVVTTTLSGE